MKSLLSLFFCLAFSVSAFSSGAWVPRSTMPAPRGSANTFTLNNRLYIVCGMTDSAFFTNDVWEYTPATDTWVQKKNFPGVPRRSAAGFTVNGKGYIVGGNGSGTMLNDVWEYQPLTDAWTRKADFSGVGRLNTLAFELHGKGYMGSGEIASFPFTINDFWEYDPIADTWQQKDSIPGTHHANGTVFADDQYGYIGLGQDTYCRDFWKYDPVSERWTAIAPFPDSSIYYCSAAYSDGKAYLVGGGKNYAFGIYRKSFVYDTHTDIWDPITPPYAEDRDRNSVTGYTFSVNGHIFFNSLVGTHGEPSGSFFEYVAATTDVSNDSPVNAPVVYPNPAHDVVRMLLPDHTLSVILYDMTGNAVVTMKPSSSLLTFTLPGDGVYVAAIVQNNITHYLKVVYTR